MKLRRTVKTKSRDCDEDYEPDKNCKDKKTRHSTHLINNASSDSCHKNKNPEESSKLDNSQDHHQNDDENQESLKKRSRRRPTTYQRRSSKRWKCKRCPEEFSMRKLMKEHARTHRFNKLWRYNEEKKIFICKTCTGEFETQEQTESHIKRDHVDSYQCRICQQTFTDTYKFCCHNLEHGDGKTLKCPLCSYATTNRTNMITHINTMHLNNYYYYCKTCGKGFNDKTIFREHENEHLGLKPFICVVCNNSFAYSKNLEKHQVNYHRVGIHGQVHSKQCPVCLRYFNRDDSLEKHVLRHEGPRPKRHLCDVCGKSYATTVKLRIHYRVHTGVRPYSCKICGKSFAIKDCLTTHEKTHTGEKPFCCEFCGKHFRQAISLKIHRREHTGERPYVCQFCNNGFKSKGSLDVHRKICPS